MSWSYRKRVKVIPGVYLNLSKSGISTSIGVKGASVTLGRSGAYLNTGIPGTGLYQRKKLGGQRSEVRPTVPITDSASISQNVSSAEIESLTSENMHRVKDAIQMAHQQRADLATDMSRVRNALNVSRIKLIAGYVFIFGLFFKRYVAQIKRDIAEQKNALTTIKDQLLQTRVTIKFDFDPDLGTQYQRVISKFKILLSSNKIWDVTCEYSNDRGTTRSSASSLVVKKAVSFRLGELADLHCETPALIWKNANGGDLYLYPNFAVVWDNKTRFAVVGYDELSLEFSSIRFVESDPIPADAQIIDNTWSKVNKNGTPDKRFKSNYQIPVVRYGDFKLKTETGLNERYLISNFEAANDFAKEFLAYKAAILKLDYVPSQKSIALK